MIICEENLKELVEYFRNENEEISIIFEIGARDCKESVAFNHYYPNAKIYAYECNPNTIPICRKNIKGKNNIILNEKAISNKKGEITFFPINQQKTKTTWDDGNPGASSLFRAKNKDYIEHYVQDEITVESSTLEIEFEKYDIEHVDLLWMDIQGAELLALKGAGKKINKIKYIHLEVEFQEIYEGQPLFWEIKSYLNENNFDLVSLNGAKGFSADAIFINRLFSNNLLKNIRYRLNNKFLHPIKFYLK